MQIQELVPFSFSFCLFNPLTPDVSAVSVLNVRLILTIRKHPTVCLMGKMSKCADRIDQWFSNFLDLKANIIQY